MQLSPFLVEFVHLVGQLRLRLRQLRFLRRHDLDHPGQEWRDNRDDGDDEDDKDDDDVEDPVDSGIFEIARKKLYLSYTSIALTHLHSPSQAVLTWYICNALHSAEIIRSINQLSKFCMQQR